MEMKPSERIEKLAAEMQRHQRVDGGVNFIAPDGAILAYLDEQHELAERLRRRKQLMEACRFVCTGHHTDARELLDEALPWISFADAFESCDDSVVLVAIVNAAREAGLLDEPSTKSKSRDDVKPMEDKPGPVEQDITPTKIRCWMRAHGYECHETSARGDESWRFIWGHDLYGALQFKPGMSALQMLKVLHAESSSRPGGGPTPQALVTEIREWAPELIERPNEWDAGRDAAQLHRPETLLMDRARRSGFTCWIEDQGSVRLFHAGLLCSHSAASMELADQYLDGYECQLRELRARDK